MTKPSVKKCGHKIFVDRIFVKLAKIGVKPFKNAYGTDRLPRLKKNQEV